ncbi:MAG: hypothetical protein ACRENE_34600, partial [Polyangiaceae bacterium]
MAKNILVVSCDIAETRVALIESGIIAELHIERRGAQPRGGTVGDVCLGKVTRVLPGLQAAFIDIGLERAAFLHVEDLIRPDDFEAYLTGARKPAGGGATDSETDAPPDAAELEQAENGGANGAAAAPLAEPGGDPAGEATSRAGRGAPPAEAESRVTLADEDTDAEPADEGAADEAATRDAGGDDDDEGWSAPDVSGTLSEDGGEGMPAAEASAGSIDRDASGELPEPTGEGDDDGDPGTETETATVARAGAGGGAAFDDFDDLNLPGFTVSDPGAPVVPRAPAPRAEGRRSGGGGSGGGGGGGD